MAARMPTPLRILLVEDNADEAELLLRELRRGGYAPQWTRVETPSGLRAALADRQWDVITCDWVMPQFSAPAALQLIADAGVDLPVIIVSGQVGEEFAVTAMKAGAHDFVGKNRLARLVPAIERELREAEARRAQRRAEAAARQSTDRLRLFVEHTPAPVAMLDREMRYVAYSRRWLSDFQLGDESLVGRSHYDVFPEIPEGRRAIHRRCMAGAVERGEGEFVHADGRIDWLRWEVLPWNDDAGDVGGLMILTEVLNERKRAEATLQASEEQYRELVESLNDAIFATDADGIVTYMSPVIRTISQYTPEDVVGRSFAEFVHPDDLPALAASLERTLRDGREPAEYRVVDRDGGIRWVRTFSRVVRDGEQIVGLRGVLSDITAAKQAEEVYRALVDHALQGLAIIQDGQIVFANRALEDLTGHAVAGLDGLPLLEWIAAYVHPDDRAGILAGMATWQPGRGEVRRQEFRVRLCDGGERWVTTLRSDLTYRGRDAVQVLFADVTTRRHAEDELRRLNAELEARVHERTAALEASAEQLEAFSYSVSHDLRAPLRAIDGFSQAVLEDYGALLPDAGVGYLRRVRAGAQRMAELIDRLLTLSGALRGELRRERLDLGVLAREVAVELSGAEPDRTVAFRAADGLVVDADAVLLRAALVNLLGNAWKFTRRRAQARVELGRCDAAQPTFYVRDNGVGFAMPDPAKLFRPFQRLHPAEEFEGHGIGLATVQRIVQRHGGRVWADSVPGQGATFYFTLGG